MRGAMLWRRTARFPSPHLRQSIAPSVLPLVQPHPLTGPPEGREQPELAARSRRERRGEMLQVAAGPSREALPRVRIPRAGGEKGDLNPGGGDFSPRPATEEGSGLR